MAKIKIVDRQTDLPTPARPRGAFAPKNPWWVDGWWLDEMENKANITIQRHNRVNS